MSTISTAVGPDRVSEANGYNLEKGNFNTETQNLPQAIAILGEANTANQAGLTVGKVELTSAEQARVLFGGGSPIHRVMSILRPQGSDGVGGIPTIVYPQLTVGGATATIRAWTVTGTATSNATHTVVVNGRTSLDYQYYSFDVVVGDTSTVIAAKIATAISGVLGAPCSATSALGVVTATSKWKGLTSAQLDVAINYGSNAAGLTYAQTTSTNGTGSVDISTALSQFGDDWNTIVVNTYDEAQLDALEQFNGFPSDVNPTGRYSGLIFKPFIAYFGNNSGDKSVLATITDNVLRVNKVTNRICIAPNSKGFLFETAANNVLLASIVAQNTPHLDISGLSYPDMPIPANGDIGDLKNYNDRDFLVKKGCSTVTLVDGAYQVKDAVTTYHPAGEVPLQYSYARNLNIDFNIKHAYNILVETYLNDKVLIQDGQTVSIDNAIKPREWKTIVYGLFDRLAEIGLINDPQFSKDSLRVQISATNPNRFETAFNYKRTGTVRISSTTAKAGF